VEFPLEMIVERACAGCGEPYLGFGTKCHRCEPLFKSVGSGMTSHGRWVHGGYASMVSKGLGLEYTRDYYNQLYPDGPCGGCGACWDCNMGGCEACFHGVCDQHEGGML